MITPEDKEYIQQEYGEDVAGIIRGLIKINDLYDKSPTIESENFRNLLLSFADFFSHDYSSLHIFDNRIQPKTVPLHRIVLSGVDKMLLQLSAISFL